MRAGTAFTSNLNPFQDANSVRRFSSSSSNSTSELIRLAVPSISRFSTLKTVEIKSLGPDSDDLYDRIAALTAGTAFGEFEVRALILVRKTV